jgi:hypothetical protein
MPNSGRQGIGYALKEMADASILVTSLLVTACGCFRKRSLFELICCAFQARSYEKTLFSFSMLNELSRIWEFDGYLLTGSSYGYS